MRSTLPDRFAHDMPFGAMVTDDGVHFRLWAPDADPMSLWLAPPGEKDFREVSLTRGANGWCEAFVSEARPGWQYHYRIDGDLAVPDPASRFQPGDVHGASEIIDPRSYAWRCADFVGRPWDETILYELHLGTFTREGTARAAMARLDHLVDLGVTAVELMPVADFPGRWDWGYDGVSLFAPDASYGRPDDLKAFIDAAHSRGLMVFLDVVYNHFGPEGNYLHCYARRFFNHERHTPWGAAINFDGADSATVRRFFIENALYWIQEYRIDGLRFDAVHAITDDSPTHILDALADAVYAKVEPGRHVHLVLENDKNEAHFLATAAERPRHQYVAQWNDDIHHAYHVLLTGEGTGYYRDYADDPTAHLVRCLSEGFAYQGDPSPFRDGERRGEKSDHLPPTAFVDFLQNHDQIGNRAFGDRLTSLAEPAALEAATAVLLLAPAIPMLFMGEEWGETRPFLFFCNFGEDLQEAVREGRRKEFAAFPAFEDPRARERIPDPNAEDTFLASKLDWAALDVPASAQRLALYRRLIEVRQHSIVPRLKAGIDRAGRLEDRQGGAFRIVWSGADGRPWIRLAANLGAQPQTLSAAAAGEVVWPASLQAEKQESDALPAWSVRVTVDQGGPTAA